MQKYGFPKPNFKGFMVDNVQANWNVVQIVYGYGDSYVRMVDKECTYLFHENHSLNKHTNQLIRLELQNEHKVFCHQNKNAKSIVNVDNHYAFIHS